MTNNHHTSRHHGGGGREDCWTESETETLIESWGDRYLQLNRGNLRQKDWKDVADAVNANRDLSKVPRTDVQCKNRIDTLKKKYKLEKSKTTPSKWPFFTRLGDLIGTGGSVTRKKINTPKTAVVSVTVKSGSNPNPDVKGVVYSGGSDDESVGRMESLDDSDGMMAYKELARAIVRFGEVYERMENLKQEEMVKLEKQRMEFTRELEFQRLNMFMETQVELEKMKNNKKKKKKNKRSSATGSLSTGKKPQR
ncbi:putative transcription factor Trihelix family [Helianthus debilis subsp. tardiflorus]